VWRALLIVVALIVYGCLYPFSFHPMPPQGWNLFWQVAPSVLTRFIARDALINVLLYLPFGILAFLAFDQVQNAWLHLLIPVVLACFLSTTLELIQLMDFTRTSSLFDVACNTTGAALGSLAGLFYARPVTRLVTRTGQTVTRAAPVPRLLFCLWLGYQVFPMFPSVGSFALLAKLKTLLIHPSFSTPDAISTWIEWLAAAAIFRAVWPGQQHRISIFVLLLLLPARMFLLSRSITPSEIAGALGACIAWQAWLERQPQAARLLPWLIVAGLILHDLSPYRLSTTPQAFCWLPFGGFLGSAQDWGTVMLLKKSFWYGAAVWTFHEAGKGYWKAAFGIAALLAALEWTQRYLPGRTPEISDPLLALLLTAFMSLLQNSARARAGEHIPSPTKVK
jgi:VanZ family protein